MKKKKNELVTLVTSSHLHRVQMAKNLLANHDIVSYIIDGNLDLVYTRSFIEGIRLNVSTADYKAAQKILIKSRIFED